MRIGFDGEVDAQPGTVEDADVGILATGGKLFH
jgi:hypothetical protein